MIADLDTLLTALYVELTDLWVPKTCATWPDAPLAAWTSACQGVG